MNLEILRLASRLQMSAADLRLAAEHALGRTVSLNGKLDDRDLALVTAYLRSLAREVA